MPPKCPQAQPGSISPAKTGSSVESRRAEVRGELLQDLHHTLWDVFHKTATAYPHREALVSMWQSSTSPFPASTRPSECLRWTYDDILQKATSLSESLEKLGCGRGMKLAAILWNSAEWALLFWAAAKLGMAFVPIDARNLGEALVMLCSVDPQVVVVQDAAAAVAIESGLQEFRTPPARIHCDGPATEGWLLLSDLVARDGALQMQHRCGGPLIPPNPQGKNEHDEELASLIIFTSGTTGPPKGCRHTSRNLVAGTSDYDPNIDPGHVDRWLVHTPVFHIFACNNAVRGWKCGDAVVFPSKSFDVTSTLRALVEEKCTIMSATPTLAKALMNHCQFPGIDAIHLSLISLGGTSIGQEDIELCKRGLGAKDAIQAFGMSEGAPLISWSRKDPMLIDGYHSGIGKALPGVNIRICHPGTTMILSRMEVGELHVSGSPVITSYLDGRDEDSFYFDEAEKWFMTGDQAQIDENDVVHILGRYKDLIIRGGESIQPTKIESALEKFQDLQAIVVGVPDDLAGQVPVAVVKLPGNVTKAHVAQQARRLGLQYALDAIYTLTDLSLSTFPTTALGKPKRGVLQQAVMRLRETRVAGRPGGMEKVQHFQELLKGIWSDLLGTIPRNDMSLSFIADSITFLQYCDRVLRATGQRLYLQDMSMNDTIEKQAQLLYMRSKQEPARFSRDLDNGTPHEHHLIPNYGLSSKLPPITSPQKDCGLALVLPSPGPAMSNPPVDKELVSAQETLGQLQLPKCKVQYALPIRASLHRMVRGQRSHSYYVRITFRVHKVNAQHVRHCLREALRTRDLFRSILHERPDGQPEHIVVGLDDDLFNSLVRVRSVTTEEHAERISQDGSVNFHNPAFMFNATIIEIHDTKTALLSLTYNHSVIDALSLLTWHQDLERLMECPYSALPPQTPYKLWADLFADYSGSAPALKSVCFHVQRLRGISRFIKALWPLQQAPGWMISSDEKSVHAKERASIRDRVWKGEWETKAPQFQYPRLSRVVGLPMLTVLRKTHGISAPLFAKCAITLFNIIQTGSRYAIFNCFESGRSWPNVPSWMQSTLPLPMDIGGPTFQWLLNMNEVVGAETLLQLFSRMKRQEDMMERHVHAPWEKVVHDLHEEGPVAIDASFRQSFVWDISMGLATSSRSHRDVAYLEPVARHDWADCGFFWNAFLIDESNLLFTASWDTAQMNSCEVEEHCETLGDVMRRLGKEENWIRPINDVFHLGL